MPSLSLRRAPPTTRVVIPVVPLERALLTGTRLNQTAAARGTRPKVGSSILNTNWYTGYEFQTEDLGQTTSYVPRPTLGSSQIQFGLEQITQAS